MSEIAPHILDGKCRYRDEMLKLDRVLCIDSPGYYPVLTLAANGDIGQHRANGESPAGKEWDLIPQAPEPRGPRAMHVTFREDGSPSNVCMAIQDVHPESVVFVELLPGYELVKTGEVLPEQEEPVAPAFKVGDRVVTHEFNSSGFVPWMREFVGKAGRIVLRSPSGNFLVHSFWWPASALTLVEEPAPESEPEVRYYTARGWLYRVKARHPKSVDFRGHQGAEWEESLMYASDLMQRNPGIVETDAAGVPLEGGER